MEKISNNETVYNEIETAFFEYFESMEISLAGLDYMKIPNSTYQAAFIYIHDTVIKDKYSFTDFNNMNQDIIDYLIYITDCFVKIVRKYNILSFQQFYCDFVGISRQTLYSWSIQEFEHKGFGRILSDIAKKVINLPKSQTMNRLADDRTGAVVLANNDLEVGLEYNGKRQLEEAAARQITSGTDLKSLISSQLSIGKSDNE